MAKRKRLTARRIHNALLKHQSRAEVVAYLGCSESGFHSALQRYPNAILSAAHALRTTLIEKQDCFSQGNKVTTAGDVLQLALEVLEMRRTYLWRLYSRMVREGEFSADAWANPKDIRAWGNRPKPDHEQQLGFKYGQTD